MDKHTDFLLVSLRNCLMNLNDDWAMYGPISKGSVAVVRYVMLSGQLRLLPWAFEKHGMLIVAYRGVLVLPDKSRHVHRGIQKQSEA